MATAPSGYSPKWLQPQMATAPPNGFSPKWLQPQMATAPNGYSPKWLQPQMATAPNGFLKNLKLFKTLDFQITETPAASCKVTNNET